MVVVTGLPGTGKSTLAEHAALLTGASVLGWDRVTAGLVPFSTVQSALEQMSTATYVRVGWSVLWNLAELQLRHARSVVLDAVAGPEQVAGTRELSDRLQARLLVVVTQCSDIEARRHRVEGRSRGIPGWHEVRWAHVESLRERFVAPEADLVVDSAQPVDVCVAQLARLLRIDSCP